MPKDDPIFDLINESTLFDEEFYSRQTGLPCRRSSLIDHYVKKGEAENYRPSLSFEPSFYRICNPDVESLGFNLLAHFLTNGAAEGRYPTRQRLALDARKIEASNMFDASFYARKFPKKLLANSSGAEQYLAFWRLGHRCNPDFDDTFYLSNYADMRGSGRAPIMHYLEIGRGQGRFTNQLQVREACEATRGSFDEVYYRAQAADEIDQSESAAEHYFVKGAFKGYKPSQEFDQEYYLLSHPDVQRAGAEPFVHFSLYGRKEGRLGHINVESLYRGGKRQVFRDRPTLLIVNHEASRTGAPLLGLNIARRLAERRFNIVTFLGRDGKIADAFADVSVEVVIGSEGPLHPANVPNAEFILRALMERYAVSAVILNSAETDYFAEAALQAGLPSLALIHEFSEYTLPTGRLARAVSYCDRVIAPAKLVADSLQKEVTALCGSQSHNIVVKPQGLLDWLPEQHDASVIDIGSYIGERCGPGLRVVLGAGAVQIRKGVDLFVQTAAELLKLRDDVVFVWVGELDASGIHYSLWLDQMVQRMGLANRVLFLPAQSSLDAVLSLADIFYLSSRLDPFPNVVIDALEAGKYVVCFREATGCAELIDSKQAVGAAVPHCDIAAAAQAISRALDDGSRDAAAANTELVRQAFDFSSYIDFIERELDRAASSRRVLSEQIDSIAASGAFDPKFYEGHAVGRLSAVRSIRRYSATASKGLSFYSSRPGFSDHVFRSKDKISPGEIPLLKAIATSGPIKTHTAIDLADLEPAPLSGSSVAIHIHLHYSDLAAEFLARLDNSIRADLFVTATSLRGKYEAEYVFSRYTSGEVTVALVANRGRDLAPFCGEFARFALNGEYEIVGHFHGKKSLAIGGDAGARWRTFLLENLLAPSVTPRLLPLFEREPELGLIFAEDRHCVGWSKNRPLAEQLNERMQPRAVLPNLPYFPLGTMFWARSKALQPLWQANLQEADFPAEPAAYDGTIMHALERLIPSICEAAGYRWLTVFNSESSW